MTKETMSALVRLTRMNHFAAEFAQIEAGALFGLRRLRRLERVSLHGASISDEELAFVRSHPALIELDLSATTITDDDRGTRD